MAQDVATWREVGGDLGFTQYFHASKARPADPPYLDRTTLAIYITSQSVKLQYACKLFHDALFCDPNTIGGKLLVYVNWPHTQWLVRATYALRHSCSAVMEKRFIYISGVAACEKSIGCTILCTASAAHSA